MTRMDRQERVLSHLQAMAIGGTKVVYDRVVTRWAADAFEVDTFGRAYFTGHAVATTIAGDYDLTD